jgi:hypothetical protein
MLFFKKLLKKKKPAVIAVGTSIETYGLCALLRKSGKYEVKFVINDEPWQHKTKFAGAECRYPSELIALIHNHTIKAVLCFETEKLCKEIQVRENDIKSQGCALVWCNKNAPRESTIDDLNNVIS